MRKGRTLLLYSALFMAGDIAGQAMGPMSVPIQIIAILTISILAFYSLRQREMAAVSACFLLLGILASCGGSNGSRPVDFAGHPLMRRAAAAKEYLSGKEAHLLPEESAEELSVLRAFTLGDKSGLDRATKSSYRDSGGMHLLALSGLHIGIVYAFLSFILSIMGNSRKAKMARKCAILLTLWTYAFVTGLGASISRATIMITAYELSDIFTAQRDLSTALALSAMAITLFNPDAPFAIGFQLSFGAMASIRWIYPYLKRLLNCRTAIMGYIWNCVALSISCQIATTPLAYFYFGTFPKFFMITNLTATPLASAIICMAPVTAVLSKIPLLSEISSKALHFMLHLLGELMRIIAGL